MNDEYIPKRDQKKGSSIISSKSSGIQQKPSSFAKCQNFYKTKIKPLVAFKTSENEIDDSWEAEERR